MTTDRENLTRVLTLAGQRRGQSERLALSEARSTVAGLTDSQVALTLTTLREEVERIQRGA
jgi:hypothetical protein